MQLFESVQETVNNVVVVSFLFVLTRVPLDVTREEAGDQTKEAFLSTGVTKREVVSPMQMAARRAKAEKSGRGLIATVTVAVLTHLLVSVPITVYVVVVERLFNVLTGVPVDAESVVAGLQEKVVLA
jgi:hypothetical protein